MSASTSGGGGPLSPQAAAALQEGIGLVFGRWTALQMAVENEWGGRDSRAKADQLAASIFSWFANSNGIHSSSSPSTSSYNSVLHHDGSWLTVYFLDSDLNNHFA
jgi:hypothetical protein